MDISSHINKLIPLLDCNDDYFLIQLLENKIKCEYQKYLSKHNVSDYDLRIAKKGVSLTMSNYAEMICLDEDQKSFNNRIDGIITDCDNCKHSIIKTDTHDGESYSYKINNWESDVCISCCRRTDNLQDMKHDPNDLKWEIISRIDPIFLEDHIKIKAIINKLKRKIKDYDAS